MDTCIKTERTEENDINNAHNKSNKIKSSKSLLHSCKYCLRKYKLLVRLKCHETVCSRNVSEILLQDASISTHKLANLNNQNGKVKSCSTRGQTFKYKKVLKKHEAVHKQKLQFSCKYCEKHFLTKDDKELHKINEHADRINKKRKCKICQELVFETEEEYFVHINETHKGKYDDYHMCSDCGKQFKTKGELTNHNKSQCGTIKQYKCEVCNQKLMTAGSLYNHMLRHTVKCSNMCGFCGKMFLTVGQLKVHERTHTQEKAFVCDVCGKGFCHRQSLITHSTLHTGVKPYQCESCGNSFSCVGNLIKHRRTHADTCGVTPLTNHRVDNPSTKMKVKINTPPTSKLKTIKKEKEIQDKLTACKNKLQKFVRNHDGDNSQDVKTEPDEKHLILQSENIKCINDIYISDKNVNPSIETRLNSLKVEVNLETTVVHSEGPAKANDLDNACERYDSEDSKNVGTEQLTTKMKKTRRSNRKVQQHKIAELELQEFMVSRGLIDETAENACQYCNKMYTNIKWLFRHEKEHERLKDMETSNIYKCSCCKTSFNTREACREHQHNFHADILSCQECDKIFSNVDSLRSHERIFHKGLPKKVYVYVCEKCGAQLRQRSLLSHHEKNNCGEGPIYKCHICGKDFHSIHTRRSHLRIHDPKKKFLCKFCDKNFRWKGQLKVHERSHTGEKPFKCLYCPKAFGYRESLITHSTLHTGIKPHLCQACGSRFSCIGNLIKHRTTHASTCGVWYSKNQ